MSLLPCGMRLQKRSVNPRRELDEIRPRGGIRTLGFPNRDPRGAAPAAVARAAPQAGHVARAAPSCCKKSPFSRRFCRFLHLVPTSAEPGNLGANVLPDHPSLPARDRGGRSKMPAAKLQDSRRRASAFANLTSPRDRPAKFRYASTPNPDAVACIVQSAIYVPSCVTVDGTGGDWSIFRPINVDCRRDLARKHGPSPFPPPRERLPVCSAIRSSLESNETPWGRSSPLPWSRCHDLLAR